MQERFPRWWEHVRKGYCLKNMVAAWVWVGVEGREGVFTCFLNGARGMIEIQMASWQSICKLDCG